MASCASFEIIQKIADEWETLGRASSVEPNGGRAFLFGGGERSECMTKAVVPNDSLPNGLGIHVVASPNTPLLLGLDTIRQYGLVLEYHHNTFTATPSNDMFLRKYFSGHIGVRVLPDLEKY